eukprot:scaffold11075_cov132-Isochrysis_galbana.AAC.11
MAARGAAARAGDQEHQLRLGGVDTRADDVEHAALGVRGGSGAGGVQHVRGSTKASFFSTVSATIRQGGSLYQLRVVRPRKEVA